MEKVISKSDIVANKTVTSYRYVLTDKRVRLYAGSVTNDASFLNFNKRSDKYIILKFAFINIGRFYDGHILS